MSRDPREIINAYDLSKATGIPSARPITGRGRGWAYEDVERWGDDAWDEMVKATGIPSWVRAGGRIGAWFPATIIEKAASLGLFREEGRKLIWSKPGRPCDEQVVGDGWGGSGICERICVAEIPKSRWTPGARTTSDRVTKMVPVCSLHAKVHDRQVAESEARNEADRIRREKRDRQQEHTRLAEELLEWGADLLAELGIHPKTITIGSIGEKTGLLLPAEAVATLIQEATGERYPGRPSGEEG